MCTLFRSWTVLLCVLLTACVDEGSCPASLLSFFFCGVSYSSLLLLSSLSSAGKLRSFLLLRSMDSIFVICIRCVHLSFSVTSTGEKSKRTRAPLPLTLLFVLLFLALLHLATTLSQRLFLDLYVDSTCCSMFRCQQLRIGETARLCHVFIYYSTISQLLLSAYNVPPPPLSQCCLLYPALPHVVDG